MKIKVPQTLHRGGTATAAEDGTLILSISSDEPYERYDFWNDKTYMEVLDHSPGGVDLSRLKNGAALLYNHDRDVMLGTLSEPECKDGRCYVKAKISAAPDVESFRIKIGEGILKDTSIGYALKDEGEEIGQTKDGIPILKFKFSIHEASLVTIPADPSVGVGRQRSKPEGEPKEILIPDKKSVDVLRNENDNDGQVQDTNMKIRQFLSEPDNGANATTGTAPKIDVKEVESSAITKERKRVGDIQELSVHFRDNGLAGRKIDTSEMASQFIKEGKSLDEFQNAVVRGNFKEPQAVHAPAQVGLNEGEKKKFSLLRGLRLLADKRPLDGLEKEVSEAAAKAGKLTHRSDAIYLPDDISSYDMRDAGLTERDMQNYVRTGQNVGTGPTGGFTVPTILGSMIEYLRNSTVVGRAGITTMSGLSGDMSFPVQITGSTAGWVGESGSQADSAATFAIKNVTPHRLSGTIPFTSQFLAQSSLPAEQFARNELMTVGAIAIDLAGLEGTGTSGQPLGVKGTPSVGADVTFSTAATWAKVVLFETSVNTANANIGDIKFILSSAAVGKWKGILRASAAGAKFLIDDDMTANGYPVLRTNQVTGDIAYFGVWSQLMHFMWATQEFIVDPYALKKTGGVEVTMNSFHDFLVRQPAAFEVSTDSAAQ